MSMIYSDEQIEAFFSPGASTFLLVTFAPMNMKANGSQFWGRDFVRKNKIASLGIIAKRPNWYPVTSVASAIAAAKNVISHFNKIVSYGVSMGGYAAIKFSDLLGCSTIIAFSPQYSIDPEDVGSFDQRFTKFFDRRLNLDHIIQRRDIKGELFLFYDPYMATDKAHAQFIALQKPDAHLICVPMTGHKPGTIFAGSQSGTGLIANCMAADLSSLKRSVDTLRRPSATRRLGLAEMALPKRPQLALDLLEPSLEVYERPDAIRVLYKIAEASLRYNLLELASRAVTLSFKIKSQDAGTYRIASDVAFRQNDFAEALYLIERAIELASDYPFAYSRLAAIQHKMGLVKQARSSVQKALSLRPHDLSLLRLQERINL